MASRNFSGIVSSRASVPIRIGPSRYRRPSAIIAFRPYWVRLEIVRMKGSIDTPSMKYQVRVVDIRDLDGDELAASGDLGDAILAILARVKSRSETIRRVLDKIVKLKGREREVAVEQLAIVAGLRGI